MKAKEYGHKVMDIFDEMKNDQDVTYEEMLHYTCELGRLSVNYPRLKAGASCFDEGPCCTASPQALFRAVPALPNVNMLIAANHHES